MLAEVCSEEAMGVMAESAAKGFGSAAGLAVEAEGASAKGFASEKSSSARVRFASHNVAAARPQQEMSPMNRNKVRSFLKPLGGVRRVAADRTPGSGVTVGDAG